MTSSNESAHAALSSIDGEFCRHATDELTQILVEQDRQFAPRFDAFENPAYRRKFVHVGRVIAVSLSIFGFVICALTLAIYPYGGWRRPEVPLMAVFVALGLFAWFAAPVLSERLFQRTTQFRENIRAWSAKSSATSYGKLAARVLKKATALAPYEARYTLMGSILRAERLKNGQTDVAWQRDLTKYRRKGHGISGDRVTVIVRRRGSRIPAVCILHLEPDWIRRTLQKFEIPVHTFRRDAQAETSTDQ